MSLKQFQKTIGTKPDGKLGPKTIAAAAEHIGISKIQAAHFFAQCAHETNNFKRFEENLNYTKADNILRVFSWDFDENKDKKINPLEREKAESMVKSPEALANFVYANQNGNGPESSGEGWKYRGRGAIQLTGRANYQAFAMEFDCPIVMSNPELVATKYAFESAIFYFNKRGIWKHAHHSNTTNIKRITRLINGGYNGLADRIKKTDKMLKWA
jgi:putative chitinase